MQWGRPKASGLRAAGDTGCFDACRVAGTAAKHDVGVTDTLRIASSAMPDV